jgi:hypothetical protein
MSFAAALLFHGAVAWAFHGDVSGRAESQENDAEPTLLLSVETLAAADIADQGPHDSAGNASSVPAPSTINKRRIASPRSATPQSTFSADETSPVLVAHEEPRLDLPTADDGIGRHETVGASGTNDGVDQGDRHLARIGDSGTAEGRGRHASSSRSLEHGPRLLTSNDPCHGMFPYDAPIDAATVTISVSVKRDGRAASPRVVDVRPSDPRFALAAASCARLLRFEPAADASGTPVMSESVVQLRFARR